MTGGWKKGLWVVEKIKVKSYNAAERRLGLLTFEVGQRRGKISVFAILGSVLGDSFSFFFGWFQNMFAKATPRLVVVWCSFINLPWTEEVDFEFADVVAWPDALRLDRVWPRPWRKSFSASATLAGCSSRIMAASWNVQGVKDPKVCKIVNQGGRKQTKSPSPLPDERYLLDQQWLWWPKIIS